MSEYNTGPLTVQCRNFQYTTISSSDYPEHLYNAKIHVFLHHIIKRKRFSFIWLLITDLSDSDVTVSLPIHDYCITMQHDMRCRAYTNLCTFWRPDASCIITSGKCLFWLLRECTAESTNFCARNSVHTARTYFHMSINNDMPFGEMSEIGICIPILSAEWVL